MSTVTNIALSFVTAFAVYVVICMFFIMWGWSWFMVPVFGMEALTWGQAFGFSLLANCFGRSKSW